MKRQLFIVLAVFAFEGTWAQLPDFIPSDELVAWYPFNSTSEDAGPGGFDMCASEISYVTGRWGDANGAYSSTYGGQILSSCGAEGAWSEEITYSMWFNSNDLTVDPYPSDWFALLTMNGWSHSALGVLLSIQGGNSCSEAQCLIRPHWPSDQGFGECADVVSNEWYHLCVTGNQDSSNTYLNGQMILSSIHDDDTDFSEVPFGWTLGASLAGHTYHFKGAFDDVGIWNRALSQDEVMMLFNAPAPTSGCIDENACNYNTDAQIDDGSCVPCAVATSFCGEGTTWNAESQTCIISNTSDTDFDGCVGMVDLLDLLSVFGTCIELDGPAEAAEWTCGEPVGYQGYDYATVLIGEQCWFAENLRAEAYANGDEITSQLSESAWNGATAGATVVYGDGDLTCYDYAPDLDACGSGQSLSTFGRVYNWHSVADERGVCPTGWQVPSDLDWSVMEQAIGMAPGEAESSGWRGTNEGSQLKSQIGWSSGSGTDNWSFNGLPAGHRHYSGTYFDAAGNAALFWTATELDSERAWFRILSHSESRIQRTPDFKTYGCSVRCIKDPQ